jgi:hypothetical protein
MECDVIHYVFDLLSIKKELRAFVVEDFLSCFDFDGKLLSEFVKKYLGEYRSIKYKNNVLVS